MNDEIVEKIRACFINGAIGDALGSSVEGWTRSQILDEHGKMNEFQPPGPTGKRGEISADTLMKLFTCLSIIENDGRIMPQEFARTLVSITDTSGLWISQENVIQKLRTGANPWQSGRGTIEDATAIMATPPIGIINAANPRQAYLDGHNISGVLQEGVSCEAGATLSAGIAEGFRPNGDIEESIAVMQRFTTTPLDRAFSLSLDLAESCDTVGEFADEFYESHLDWEWKPVKWDKERYFDGELFSSSPVEIMMATIGIISFHGAYEGTELITEAASFGRDCDTIAANVGHIVGANRGAAATKDKWEDQIEKANEEVFERNGMSSCGSFADVSDRLSSALETEIEKTARYESRLKVS